MPTFKVHGQVYHSTPMYQTWKITNSPKSVTLSQRDMHLHVWSHPQCSYCIANIIEVRSGMSELLSVEFWPFPLLWLLSYITGCTTIQAMIVAMTVAICKDCSASIRENATDYLASYKLTCSKL